MASVSRRLRRGVRIVLPELSPEGALVVSRRAGKTETVGAMVRALLGKKRGKGKGCK